jgi:hypothetical protein
MSLLIKKSKFKDSLESVSLKDAFWKIVLICFASALGGLVFDLIVAVGLFQVASKPPPVLVQLRSGDSVLVEPIDFDERTPESIQKFVTEIFTIIFTWSGTMPSPSEAEKVVADPGVVVLDERGNRLGRITTSASEGSLAFDLKFRREFLRLLVSYVPESVFGNRSDVAFVPIEVQTPVPVGQGRWKVPLFANLMFVNQANQIGEVVPFNVDVYVRSVVPLQEQLVAQLTKARSKPLARKVVEIRQAGLEVYAVLPYRREDLKDGQPNFRAADSPKQLVESR